MVQWPKTAVDSGSGLESRHAVCCNVVVSQNFLLVWALGEGSHCVVFAVLKLTVQMAGLELVVLPLPPKCQHDRCVLPRLTYRKFWLLLWN